MNTLRTYAPSLLSALLPAAILFIIYPYYQYYIDPDATAYLTIVKRYVNGDLSHAVNGYWSPWGCWLTALLVKTGFDLFPAAVIVNAVGAAGLIFISQSFFVRFKLRRKLQWLFTITIGLFLCYAVFKQSFDDLWECFFLLASLRLMLKNNFVNKPGLWILNGAIGALAYFAKAYAFPFFILNLLCCSYLRAQDRKQWLRMSVTSIASLLFFSFPWIYVLHDKYGRWMTSTAGSLNMSWYLVGHPHWKEGIHALIPPVYHDSPYYWEDPYLVNGITPHFWSSPKLLLLQIARLALNLVKFVVSGSQVSIFFIPVFILALRTIFFKKLRCATNKNARILIVSFLLFPLGYILINFEARYIWYMLPLSMVIATLTWQRFYSSQINRRIALFLTVLFAASYLIYPTYDMKNMFREGETEYNMAKRLQKAGINGSFTINVSYGPQMSGIARLAYFSGNCYYNMPYTTISKEQLLADMRRYHVKYYFYYQRQAGATNFLFTDEQNRPFPEISPGLLKNIKIFLVNP